MDHRLEKTGGRLLRYRALFFSWILARNIENEKNRGVIIIVYFLYNILDLVCSIWINFFSYIKDYT